MPDLLIKRHTYTDKSTIGDLLDTDGETLICHTLEDTVRKHKVSGTTAIPAGRYEIIMREFRGSGKIYPLLLEVPFFDGIFIHGGNQATDSLGCILVGMKQGQDVIQESQKALNEFVIPKIQELLKGGKLFVNIVGGYSKEDWKV